MRVLLGRAARRLGFGVVLFGVVALVPACGPEGESNSATDNVSPGDTSTTSTTQSIAPVPFAESAVSTSNLHSMSWDGRLYSSTVADPTCSGCLHGLALGVFRPESVGTTATFVPETGTKIALSPLVPLFSVTTEEGNPAVTPSCKGHISGSPIAIIPLPRTGSNPFPSDVHGNEIAAGKYETYDLAIFSYRPRPVASTCTDPTFASCDTAATCPTGYTTSNALVRGVWKVTIQDPRTPSAAIASVTQLAPIDYLKTSDGEFVTGIEPTVSVDNDLLIYNVSDTLRYLVWTPTPGHSERYENWAKRDNNGLAAMSTNEADTVVNGLHFADRYPLAKQPLLDPAGNEFPAHRIYPGAYAWLSADASELFHTTMRGDNGSVDMGGNAARRFGQAVIGQMTNYQLRLIDSPANPNLFDTPRQVSAPLGAYPSMWTPFTDTANLAFPASPRRPLYIYFENRTATYSELPFDDVKDGDYLVYLHMNEMIAQSLHWDGNRPMYNYSPPPNDGFIGLTEDEPSKGQSNPRTPDTSGYYVAGNQPWKVNGNHGFLMDGANFPADVGPIPENAGITAAQANVNVGISGQAIQFPQGSSVVVHNSPAFDRIAGQMSVELWSQCKVGYRCKNKDLVRLPGAYSLGIDPDGHLAASVTLGPTPSAKSTHTVVCTSTSNQSLTDKYFHAVGFSYHINAARKPVIQIYQDGKLTGATCVDSDDRQVGSIYVSQVTADLAIGPKSTAAGVSYPCAAATCDTFFVLDEFALSDIARQDSEFLVASHEKAPPATLADSASITLPTGLSKDDLKISSADAFNQNQIDLGKRLFFDVRLSKGGATSCSTCHDPGHDFADTAAVTAGDQGKKGNRNAPSVVNRAFSTVQMRDGKAASLDSQALLPLLSSTEMGLTSADIKGVLTLLGESKAPAYDKRFAAAFPGSASLTGDAAVLPLSLGKALPLVARALAAYERSLFSGNSQVDQFEKDGTGGLSTQAQNGRVLFHGKARCIACHGGRNYTDELYHNTGFIHHSTDVGRYDVTLRETEKGSFRTPSLRNVAQSNPYLHDGSVTFSTPARKIDDPLLQLVKDYNSPPNIFDYDDPILVNDQVDAQLFPLYLSPEEETDLVEFLKALTGNYPNTASSVTNSDRPDLTQP